MKQNDIAKIQGMKAQTFGVEIEMNHITREKAAKVAAKFFGTNRYEDTAYRNGYSAWSAWDQQGREWKFQKDVSISGPDSEKCEMVTPILHYSDIEDLQELARKLRRAGAVSNANNGCGIHIHVGGDGHTPQSIRSLCNMMAKYEKTLIKTVHIDNGRLSHYCKTVDQTFLRRLNEEKPRTMDGIRRIWYATQPDFRPETTHYHDSRYHMLNLHSFFNGHGTIEFRLFQFDNPHRIAPGSTQFTSKQGIHAGHLKAMIQMCLAMSNLAKLTRYSANTCTDCAKKTDVMRWYYKLGFIGEEFTTCRKYFARDLEAGVAHTAKAGRTPARRPFGATFNIPVNTPGTVTLAF